MAPRAKASSETVEPARRSTRISAQPKVEAVKEIVKKAVTKATSKKRAADAEGANDGGDAAPTVKKVRYSCSLCLYVLANQEMYACLFPFHVRRAKLKIRRRRSRGTHSTIRPKVSAGTIIEVRGIMLIDLLM